MENEKETRTSRSDVLRAFQDVASLLKIKTGAEVGEFHLHQNVESGGWVVVLEKEDGMVRVTKREGYSTRAFINALEIIKSLLLFIQKIS